MRYAVFGGLLALFVSAGSLLYLDWVNVSTAGSPAGKSGVRFGVAQEKEAGNDVRDAVKVVKEKDKAPHTVTGQIKDVSADRREVTIARDKQPDMTVALTADTKITVNGKAAKAEDLRPGQLATCTHTTRDGREVCVTLAVGSRQ